MGGRWEADLTTAATHLLCGAAFSAKSRGAACSTCATEGVDRRHAACPEPPTQQTDRARLGLGIGSVLALGVA